MSTKILYNNIDPFSGISNIPFVAREDNPIRLHDRWGVVTTITLNGMLTGSCATGFSGLANNQRELINKFSQDYKPLNIVDNNVSVYTGSYCAIRSINFDESRYYRIVPYQITLDCYDSSLFTGTYGILNPSLNIEYQDEENGTVSITRNISAQGFVTTSADRSSNALGNAISWVQSKTGWNPSYFGAALPQFIQFNTNKVPCLKRFEEVTDRFNATYTVTEEYQYNYLGTNSSVLTYSVDIDYEDQAGVYTVTIKGDLEGCLNTPMSTIRSQFQTINFYNLANTIFKKCYPDAANLNPEWLDEEINEAVVNKKVSFTRKYDTDTLPTVIFDYTINSDRDVIEDKYSVTINGTIKGRGSLKTRWERVQNYYNNNLNLFNLANDFYIKKGYPYHLVNVPIDYSVQLNPYAGEITINSSYDDRVLPPPGYEKFDYTIEVIPRIDQKIPIAALNGKYVIQDLNSPKRAQVSINGSAYSKDFGKEEDIRNRMKYFLAQYIPSRPVKVDKDERVEYSKLPQGYEYNFNRVEGYEESSSFSV